MRYLGSNRVTDGDFRAAIQDSRRVSGLTHAFYRYPARFSPQFVGAVIERYSEPGEMVLDPFSGGGTTVVEALARKRRIVANDINPLGVFVSRVKSTPLSESETQAINEWISTASRIRCHGAKIADRLSADPRLFNLHLPSARYLKNFIAQTLDASENLPTSGAREFARCAVLKTAQWALDGRSTKVSVEIFRSTLIDNTNDMLSSLSNLPFPEGGLDLHLKFSANRTIIQGNATDLPSHQAFADAKLKADLVVTSPPYPGVHVLYHRWQIGGRRETPAPYWITQTHDGAGASYYTFGDRKEKRLTHYFDTVHKTFSAIRQVVNDDAVIVQMIAFSNPRSHLPRYLNRMEKAGFEEFFLGANERRANRVWRTVPNRKWHAAMNGNTPSAREVVLLHRPKIT